MNSTRPSRQSTGTMPSAYSTNKWKEAWTTCQENLREDDIGYIGKIQDYKLFIDEMDSLQTSVAMLSQTALVARLQPAIEPIISFAALLATALSTSSIQTAIIWGLTGLLIKVAASNASLFTETLKMLDELGTNLDVLMTIEPDTSFAARLDNDLMDIFVEIITFWAQAIRFLRRHKHATATFSGWSNMHRQFEVMATSIRRRSHRISEKVAAAQNNQPQSQAMLLQDLDRLTVAQRPGLNQLANASMPSQFPCHNVPYSKNPNFFGRGKELQEIRDTIGPALSATEFRSFALYGTGGIGKTQAALAYAFEEIENGCPAVLWVDCETGLSMARSFRIIATMLNVEGATTSENNEQNKFAVMEWMRKTAVRWLMVMDNVDDLELVRNAWPITAAGAVLVTSRHEIVSIDPAAGGFEIGIFELDDATDFLLRATGRENCSTEEKGCARELAERLNGLALALATMAAQIKIRRKTFKEFVAFYEKYATRLNQERRGIESYYKYSLSTCWETAFEDLSQEARQILSVISLISPDAIPEELFAPNAQYVPFDVSGYCDDEWLIEEALDGLREAAIVRKDTNTNVMTIHRLIQEEYRKSIGPDGARKAFILSGQLLYTHFPKHVNGLSLRNQEQQCKKYIQHVLFLCRTWQEYKWQPESAHEFDHFLELATACGWYLMESGAWSEDFELLAVAMELCKDKEGLIYAHLCNSYGIVEMERAHADAALPYMEKSLDIRQKLLPPDHEELANLFNNFGNMILQAYKEDACQTCIDYQLKAIKIDMTKPKAQRDLILHIRHANTGRTLWLLDKCDEAIWYIEEARRYAINNFGPEGHWDATCDYYRGNVSFNLKRHDEAKAFWTRALKIFDRDNSSHPSTIAARMKLACLALEEGDNSNAILTLEQLIIVSELTERAKGDKGQTARIMRKLAAAYEKSGNVPAADSMKREAESIRRRIQGDRFDKLPDNDMSYNLLVYHSFW